MTDEELALAIGAARDRARAHTNHNSLNTDGSLDFMPIVHARDAAEARIAAIGTVNPRHPGLANSIIQGIKRLLARCLNWHVRGQIEFNRASLASTQAILEALDEIKLRLELLKEKDADEEKKRIEGEIHVLRTISELESSYTLKTQKLHQDYAVEIDRRTSALREEYERLLYRELKVLRQRMAANQPTESAPPPQVGPPPEVDWLRFAESFRGPEESILARQRAYVERFAGVTGEILDLGCGRGEFLELARESGMKARGIDFSAENVALCRSKGLTVEEADLFGYLKALADDSLAGLFCAQVIEHLPPLSIPHLVQLASLKLRTGALAIFETPNPECLAIFATHFYLDPTHTRPIPPALMRFYLEEAGFGNIEIERLAPASDSITALTELPASVRDAVFGGLDYAIIGRKL